MTNIDIFRATLETQYTDLFKLPEYSYAASLKTPTQLADTMTKALVAGSGSKDGEGIKRACKALSIKHTYKDLTAYLNN
jgi:hypothetical protein